MEPHRTNVIIFPKVREVAEAAERAKQEAKERGHAKRARLSAGAKQAATTIGTGALATVLYLVFLILWWLRGPVRFLLGLASFASLITLPIMWLGLDSANKTHIMLSVAGVGLGASALMWFYDALLMRLAPEPILFST
ncbi:hypothetical protein ACEF57_23860 [Salmonella enterica subsp. enterica serovar Dublin]|uniref:Inner membrane protein n=4 Tax=Gammaproteobacteria TaxID=1236 RepID=A0A706KNL7_SALTM|nr:hypothetical protein [Bordetella avium]EDM2856828.1 hypothetical protein [Salmonella enterica subsp. enterica serovar Typhimurium]EGK2871203.1 hypothetical protein [Escherichia coli]EGW7971560.1 hypothetical protein [Salmonella enterica subsp. enterica serovar Derby]EHL9563448.1 hypothetical protein [Salmonella enterica subsp. enterica serovar Altona]EKO0236232.1 hypothetical protein [Salmonella enterica subsp. enterica serovar Schwarzengrund]HAE3585763.1 hypothetical protein [Salmonella e